MARSDDYKDSTDDELDTASQRVFEKLQKVNKEYLGWFEVLLSVVLFNSDNSIKLITDDIISKMRKTHMSTITISLDGMKKTHEEYAKEKFKKKYNFVPDKPGSSKGTIEVDGKKYNIDINSDTIESKTGDKNGNIGVDNRFFKLKGSNKSERRDAALYHEIGHQSLHNSNPKSETVDSKNRSQKYFRKEIKNSIKNKTGVDSVETARELLQKNGINI